MSAYEETSCIDKIAEVLEDRDNYNLNIDEETVEIVMKIKNHEQAEKITFEEWNHMIDNALMTDGYNTEPNYAIIMAMIHSPDFPERCMWRLFDELDDVMLLLTSDYIKEDLIYEIFSLYDTEFHDIIVDQGMDFSDTVLDFLCFELSDKEIEQDLKYIPFEFLSKDSKRLPELVDLLDNTDMSIPETLTMSVADNVRFPDAIRNKAFDRGYNPLQSNNHTEHIMRELYKVYADTVFDINPETSEESKMVKEARHRLLEYTKYNRLPESCQLDLIERCGKDGYSDDIAFEVIRHTQYPSVMSTALSVLDIKNLPEIVLENPTAIGNSAMEKLLLKVFPENTKEAFIKAMFHNPFSMDVVYKFIDLDDINVKRAIVCSYESSANQVDAVLHDSFEKPYYREMLYLKELRNVCVNFVNENNIQKIISTGLLKMASKDKHTSVDVFKTRSALIDSITKQKQTHWSNLYNNDRMVLTKTLNMLYKNFPEFQDITKQLQEKVDRTYKITQLSHKYTDIFLHHSNRKEEDLPFNTFNIQKFLDMSKEQKKEFINDIKEINDSVLTCKIMNTIEDACYEANCYQDDVATVIGECNELYNTVYDMARSAVYKYKENTEKDEEER